MRRVTSIFVLTAFLSTILTQELLFAFMRESDDYSLGVLNFSVNNSNLTRTEARILTSRFTEEFKRGGLFYTMDQNDMERGLLNKNLDTEGCETLDCAVRAGKVLGVQLVVFGLIMENSSGFRIELQMVHTASRQVVKSHSEIYQGDTRGLEELMPALFRNLIGEPEVTSTPQLRRKPPKEIDEVSHNRGRRSGFKWYYWGLGLLVAGGIGAGVVFARKGSNSSGETTTTPTLNDLPGAPSFP